MKQKKIEKVNERNTGKVSDGKFRTSRRTSISLNGGEQERGIDFLDVKTVTEVFNSLELQNSKDTVENAVISRDVKAEVIRLAQESLMSKGANTLLSSGNI